MPDTDSHSDTVNVILIVILIVSVNDQGVEEMIMIMMGVQIA